MSSLKSLTSDVMLEYYEKNGIERTLTLGREMFKHEKFREILDKGSHLVQGTVAESIAHVQAIDFIKKNNLKNWGVHEGLIIRGTDMSKKYLTELDLIVYSPSVLMLLEVKSYGGPKTITDKCTIRTRSRTYDVYDQHTKHMEALLNLFISFKKPGIGVKEACAPLVYIYSVGEIYDKRDEQLKLDMPVITEENFPEVLESYIGKPEVWDVRYIKEAIRIMESKKEELAEDHLKYVKGLRR